MTDEELENKIKSLKVYVTFYYEGTFRNGDITVEADFE